MGNWETLDRNSKIELATALEENSRRLKSRKIFTFYPETGPLRRELYVPHMKFFEAGATFRERAFMGGNGTGKTEGVGGYELSLHLTGKYPPWWVGRRFTKPISAWAAGETSETTRDILQFKLLGPIDQIGTGMIPGEDIVGKPKAGQGISDAISTVAVRHVSGGTSHLGFKSYNQGWTSFRGTERQVIWLDEDPIDDNIYTECLMRTRTVDGVIILTLTPDKGITDVVKRFWGTVLGEDEKKSDKAMVEEEQERKKRFFIMATWDNAPHLSKQDKQELLDGIPPHLRDAKIRGIPYMGRGAIYPIDENDILVHPFEIPNFWPRCGALDVGWKATAALWGAHDRENDIWYLYSEYKRGQAEPVVHAAALKSRGDWIPFVGDPASRASSQEDGKKLLDLYRQLGIKLFLADNSVEAGIFDVWTRMTTGKLKVFDILVEWIAEFKTYHRDDKGKPVKDNDHLMDCTKYLIRSGKQVERVMPIEQFMRREKIETQQNSYDPLTYGLA